MLTLAPSSRGVTSYGFNPYHIVSEFGTDVLKVTVVWLLFMVMVGVIRFNVKTFRCYGWITDGRLSIMVRL